MKAPSCCFIVLLLSAIMIAPWVSSTETTSIRGGLREGRGVTDTANDEINAGGDFQSRLLADEWNDTTVKLNRFPSLPEYSALVQELSSHVNAVSSSVLSQTTTTVEAAPIVGDTYEPIRIHTETGLLVDKATNDDNQLRIDAILGILDNVVEKWTEALTVKPLLAPLTFSDRLGTYDGKCLGSDIPVASVEDTDFYLMVEGLDDSSATCGEDLPLAYGMPCSFDGMGVMTNPRAGKLVMCLDRIDVKSGIIAERQLEEVRVAQLAEIAHALGALTDFFFSYINPKTGMSYGYDLAPDSTPYSCNDGSSILLKPRNVFATTYGAYPHKVNEVRMPVSTQVAKNLHNCQEVTGVRLEKQSTDGYLIGSCFGSYLDARLYDDDLLSSTRTNIKNYNKLTPLTLAILEDSGWYKPDYTKATEPFFGANAGCGFVNEDCIKAGTVEPESRGFFCDGQVLQTSKCDPSHSAQSFCDGTTRVYIPEEFRYFNNLFNHFGGRIPNTDYCPKATLFAFPCSDDSKCFDIKDDGSACLTVECKKGKREFKFFVSGKDYKCKNDFEEVTIDGGETFICPRISTICLEWTCPSLCSGRGVCDWDNKKGPECQCFDRGDKSDGCYETDLIFVTVDDKNPPPDESAGGGGKNRKREKKNGRGE